MNNKYNLFTFCVGWIKVKGDLLGYLINYIGYGKLAALNRYF